MSQPFKGFVGNSYYNENVQYDATRSVNLYFEIDENQTGTDTDIGQMVARPGLTAAIIALAGGFGAVRGAYTDTQGNLYVACANFLYQCSVSAGTFSADVIGTLLSTSGPVRMADNAGLLWIVDGPNGYVWQNSTFTHIIDPSWQGADFVCQYDGFFLFNVPGSNQFYWSDINSPTFTVAGGAGVDAKQGNSDPIVGMIVFARLLWLIGSQTTEIWTDNPGGTQTFQRIPGPYLQLGCLAPASLAYSEAGAIFVSTNQRGLCEVVMTPPQGYSTQKISNFCVDQQLQKYGPNGMIGATGFFKQMNGHLQYHLNPPNGTSTWVYDVTMSLITGTPCWWEETYTNSMNVQSRSLADVCATLDGYVIVGDYSKPNLYFYDFNNYTDNGAVITRMRTAPHVASGFNRVYHTSLTIECRTGQGVQGPGPDNQSENGPFGPYSPTIDSLEIE